MLPDQPHEPWKSFLRDLDAQLATPTDLHCFGGFAIAECYGLVRATGDIDVFEVRGTGAATIARLAGKGSPLHRRYRVYIDVVTVAQVPSGYEDRLTPAFAHLFTNLRVMVFEPHDLVLAKLERNFDRDREDVEAFARGPGLDAALLRSRYEREMRPLLGKPEREDLTLGLWLEMIAEISEPKAK